MMMTEYHGYREGGVYMTKGVLRGYVCGVTVWIKLRGGGTVGEGSFGGRLSITITLHPVCAFSGRSL